MTPLFDYYLYNPKTKEVTGAHHVENPEVTPIVFSTVKGPNTNPCFCIYKKYVSSDGPWDYVHGNDTRLPKEFLTQLILLGVPYE